MKKSKIACSASRTVCTGLGLCCSAGIVARDAVVHRPHLHNWLAAYESLGQFHPAIAEILVNAG